mmetsp:Transcript_44146/g.104490  ORF Transcript_44146/g.104490 Transcript_44146/m.104490 type:complete len:418 (+) Transcript_44146:88-1341(+)|eukprot:CAMPEP_0178435774 /NCGR_PEP_ID=MMETSP0689_2-20121128/34102_1 /TAXON_ID=160604 /ORGANISM="Amphidinium massartii, Strain CS-259" /LENGTH=417 /DNA_ID=CAMNT_0020057859 /DNA_START=68 /DNA_END=1321 /DNA_ORIENTATION=+
MASAEPTGSPGKYAVLAPDARGHSSWFLTRTNQEHTATMEHPFMKTIYAKTFDKEAYVQYLLGQYAMFHELEALCAARVAEEPLAAVHDPKLLRTASLEADLLIWAGPNWRERLTALTPKTKEYLESLRADGSSAQCLLCHHFLQYNAVLSGGQYLGGIVAERARADKLVNSAEGSAKGAEFFSFPSLGQATHSRVQEYIDVLDSINLSEEQRQNMLTVMKKVYGMLLGMFDELYAMAPVAGISYGESLATAAGGVKAPAAAGVPPPLPVGPLSFTLEELHKQDGQTPGAQLLVSLLGRVYDCSIGKEFFGPGGPYEMFAGRDGTYNLAVMSLKKKTLDQFEYKFDDDEKEALAEWIAYFDNRYGAPVGTLSAPTHSIRLEELPKPKKIPFSGGGDAADDEGAAASTGNNATPQSRL